MKIPLKGIISLFAILGGVGLSIQFAAQAKGQRAVALKQLQTELSTMDNVIARLDHRISEEGQSLTSQDVFYQAWLGEIVKCVDSDALISSMLVDAYALNLVPMKKEVHSGETVEFRGRQGVQDRIEVSVAGRYDRLVRFLDRLRRNYPFLTCNRIKFSVSDATVVMSLELHNCQLELPEADVAELAESEDIGDGTWTQSNDSDANE